MSSWQFFTLFSFAFIYQRLRSSAFSNQHDCSSGSRWMDPLFAHDLGIVNAPAISKIPPQFHVKCDAPFLSLVTYTSHVMQLRSSAPYALNAAFLSSKPYSFLHALAPCDTSSSTFIPFAGIFYFAPIRWRWASGYEKRRDWRTGSAEGLIPGIMCAGLYAACSIAAK